MSSIDSLEPTPLVGGISQQPETVRPASCVPDAVNVCFDLRVGVRNRPGTDFDRKFTAAPNADLDGVKWRWSTDENYIVVFGRGGGSPIFRIFRDGGGECAVTVTTAATAYLSSGSPGSASIVFCPQPEYALVINKLVNTALIATDSYSIERHRPTYRDLVAFTTTPSNYIQTDEDDGTADRGYYQYTPGTYRPAHINCQTITNPWSISYGYWNDSGYGDNAGFRIAFRRVALSGFTGGTFTTSSGTITKTGAFASYTYRPGDMIQISAGTGFTASAWYLITGKTSNDAITIAGGPGADNADTASNFTSATYGETNICRIGKQIEIVLDFTKITISSMHDVADAITKAMRDAGADNAACAWVPQTQGGAFQITGPYVGNNAMVYAPSTPSSSVLSTNGDLTNDATKPFYSSSVQVIGGTGGAAPDVSDTNAVSSRWTRVAAPAQTAGKLDPSTMPLKLTRNAANTFTLDVAAWTPRTAGDAGTNPGQKLFKTGQPIADAVTHENRLWLGGGPFVASSRVQDNFDFWIADPAQLVDSDPIDKTISGRYQGSVRFLLPWNDLLVIFHDSGQFELSSGNQPLTSTTAQLTPSTSQPTLALRPRSSNAQIFFAAGGAGASYLDVYEYFYNDLRAQSDAAKITGHVAELLPAAVRCLAVVPLHQSLVVLPSAGSSLYVYKYHYDGQEKIQSAWTRFAFDPGYRILSVMADDSKFWMLVENAATYTVGAGALTLTIPSHGYVDGNPITFSDSTTTPSVNGTKYVDVVDANTVAVYDDVGLTTPTTLAAGGTLRWHTGDFILETLSLADPAAPAGWPCSVHMDRKLTLTGVHAAGVTTFTLPNAPSVVSGSAQFNGLGSTLNYAVLGPAFGVNAGQVVQITGYSSTTVSIAGNYSAGPVVLGRFFDWSCELPKPQRRNARGRPDIRSELFVIGVTASHYKSCSYMIQSAQEGLHTLTREHAAGTSPSSGTLRTMLGGDAEKTTWTLKNVSNTLATRPAAVMAVQWEVEANPLAQTP